MTATCLLHLAAVKVAHGPADGRYLLGGRRRTVRYPYVYKVRADHPGVGHGPDAGPVEAADPLDLDAAYRQYRHQLVTMAYRIVRDRDAAEDAVHEAFAFAFSTRQRWTSRADGHPLRLLWAITRYEVLRLRRKRACDGTPVEWIDTVPDFGHAFAEPSSPRMARLVHALHEALPQLAPRGRQVITLHYWEALSWNEIGERVGIAAATAYNIHAAALPRLRQLIQQILAGKHPETVNPVLAEALGTPGGLDVLSPRQRLIVQLHHVEGLPYRQIAQRLAISPGTVNAHLTQALARLRTINPAAYRPRQAITPDPVLAAAAADPAQLARLTPQQRETVQLCYGQGLSHAEAAKRIGVARQAIWHRCRAARHRLDPGPGV